MPIDRRDMLGGLLGTALAVAPTIRALAQAAPAAGWKTLPTEPYPGKQDDIVFVSRSVGCAATALANPPR